MQKRIVFFNVLQSAANILRAMKELGIRFEKEEREVRHIIIHMKI